MDLEIRVSALDLGQIGIGKRFASANGPSGRIVGYSYRAQIDPAVSVTS